MNISAEIRSVMFADIAAGCSRPVQGRAQKARITSLIGQPEGRRRPPENNPRFRTAFLTWRLEEKYPGGLQLFGQFLQPED